MTKKGASTNHKAHKADGNNKATKHQPHFLVYKAYVSFYNLHPESLNSVCQLTYTSFPQDSSFTISTLLPTILNIQAGAFSTSSCLPHPAHTLTSIFPSLSYRASNTSHIVHASVPTPSHQPGFWSYCKLHLSDSR